METEKIKNNLKISNDLKRLNETETIKINNSDEERLIFKNSEEVFNIFSDSQNESSLNPWNDYTYIWLNDFLNDILYILESETDINDALQKFEDNFYEYVEPPIYTHELLKWLGHRNDNLFYMDDAIKEGYVKDGFNLLQEAYTKAKEESYYTYLEMLKSYLNKKCEVDL